ncbi:GNAT family N-acetyltransferase [uncultured Pontibacter sp.]|uniref:GNAT family N-acetyltransferase n=1 Tax=uncultured Pontibacter sp. TaxID=453356 RepID=UPI002603F9C8|nr:GNAT family N-acetyltransferase [uncultured Pontibacter sp.]
MLTLTKTHSTNPDFISLVRLLDKDLAIRDGEEHAFYAQFNKIDSIKHVIVAYKEGEPAGCGAIKQYAEGVAEVKRMFVHPDFRGQGIAKSILAALEAWAKELKYKTTILETGTKQPEAIALYKSSGYRQISNYGQYAGVENSLCFKKEL